MSTKRMTIICIDMYDAFFSWNKRAAGERCARRRPANMQHGISWVFPHYVTGIQIRVESLSGHSGHTADSAQGPVQ